MKSTRPYRVALLLAVCASIAPVVHAATVCTDDPERCSERGAAATRTPGMATVAAPSHVVCAPVTPAAATTAARKPTPTAPRRATSKPARVTPSPSFTAPATPGMGMLLKLSGGANGDVSWFPGHAADNSSASWVL